MQQTGPVSILSLGTAVPPYCNEQSFIAEWMIEQLERPPALSRWLNRLYQTSGIERRYTCLPDGEFPPAASRFGHGLDAERSATTFERMLIYEREAVAVGLAAAQRCLEGARDAAHPTSEAVAASVTHLIAVSCTGFFAPGLDLALARRLGLPPTVERTLVGFMGCAAAFNALRLAASIVRGQPEARVLIVCVELCSLHIQPGTERVDLVVASLFSDGSGAALVGAADAQRRAVFEIKNFYTGVKPDTEEHMVWRIGNQGFVLHLSPEIPAHLATVAPAGLRQLTGGRADLRFWAIHPGGRGIVDKLAEIFGLEPCQIEPSYAVLRDYGNMSSATVLFVLDEWRRRLGETASGPTEGVAMAFGPGLVAEMAHLVWR
jgi:predicted naringenin-chalcone synthase